MLTETDRILFKDFIQKVSSHFIEGGWITVSDVFIHSAIFQPVDIPEGPKKCSDSVTFHASFLCMPPIFMTFFSKSSREAAARFLIRVR